MLKLHDFCNRALYRALDPDTVEWPVVDKNRGQTRAAGDPASVERIAQLIASAQSPVLISGSGVLWSQASEAMRRFVEATGIPFYTTPQGRGVVPEDHEYCFLNARSQAFKNADLVIVLGTRINYVLNHLKVPRFHADAKIVRIDLDSTEVASTPRLAEGLVADARLALEQLTQACEGRVTPERFQPWRSRLQEDNARRAQAQAVLLESARQPIHPLRLCKEIRDFMDRDAVLAVDGQEILNFGRQSIPSFVPGHRINSGTFGTMGVGLPYAIGAKAACPDKQVICLHGDGSIGFNFMELDTAVRHRIPVITVVSLNGGWTSDPQKLKPGRDLGLTRFHDMAAALGCHAWLVEDPDQIRPALEAAKQATRDGLPALINVVTDPDAQATTAKFTTFYDAA